MKIVLLLFGIVISFFSYSKLEDGNYSIKRKNNNEVSTLIVRVRNSEILYFDFDKIDSNGIKLSTKDSVFRKEKENIKEFIRKNKTLEKLPELTDETLNKDFKELFEILNKTSEPGEFEF